MKAREMLYEVLNLLEDDGDPNLEIKIITPQQKLREWSLTLLSTDYLGTVGVTVTYNMTDDIAEPCEPYVSWSDDWLGSEYNYWVDLKVRPVAEIAAELLERFRRTRDKLRRRGENEVESRVRDRDSIHSKNPEIDWSSGIDGSPRRRPSPPQPAG